MAFYLFVRLVPFVIPFLAAGSIAWTGGWILLCVMAITMGIYVTVLKRTNPGLLAVRMGRFGTQLRWERATIGLAVVFSFALLQVAGLDYRIHPDRPDNLLLQVAGILIHFAGFAMGLSAMAVNPFAEITVNISPEHAHRVVEAGAYRLVRHPVYAGLAFMNLGWPLILGSMQAFVCSALLLVIFMIRAAKEDQYLRDHLPGYVEYSQRTRSRFLPGIW